MRLLVLILFTSLLANASEVVHLKNGDRVTGEVVKLDDTKLVLKSALFGDVRIDLAQVTRIESGKNFTVDAANHSYSTQTLTFTEDRAELSISESEAVSVPRQEIAQMYSSGHRPVAVVELGFWTDWASAFDIGLSAARGTSNTTNLNFGFKAARITDGNRIGLGMTSLYAQNSTSGESVTSANAFHAATRYDLNINDTAFTFALANFDTDQLQNLDLRAVLGGGAGVRLRQSSNTSFDLFGGASLNQEVFSTEPARRSGELITGQELRLKLTPRTEFTERLMFFPNFTQTGEYRVAFDSTAVLKVNSWLGMADSDYQYLSDKSGAWRACQ
jgi:putative salt-induced outer membrane protein YdiY